MKNITLLFAFSFIVVSAFAQTSKADKEFAIKYLKATHQNILEVASGLSEEAWNYTPKAGGWSAANCLEHILTTEEAFMGMATGILAQSEPTDEDLSGADGILIGRLANRGTKVTTAPQFEPSGRWNSKEDMLAALEVSRSKLIDLNNSDADLRNYKGELPIGKADMLQLMLVISAHSQRHTFQMSEVIAEYKEM